MLSRLEIQDFALIDHAVLDLHEGLTVLTGETGAGKSIVIDSIEAITGNRVGKDVVRRGCDCATITAVFDGDLSLPEPHILEDAGITADGQSLVVTREIYQNGKTYARANGKIIPMTVLRDLTKSLLDIHGQHENQSIFKTDMQLDLLDRFGGEDLLQSIARFQKDLVPYGQCQHALKDFIVDESQKEQMIDMLSYQIQEIKSVHPKTGEDAELSARRKMIANAEKIRTVLEESLFHLNGESGMPALAAVTDAKNRIEHQLGNYEEYRGLSESLTDIAYRLEDACEQIRGALETIAVEPGELEKIDERLDRLFRLKKKYGGSTEAVLEFYKNAAARLEAIRSGEERAKALQKEKETCRRKLLEDAENIHELRVAAAKILEQKICAELEELGMKGTRFSVVIEYKEYGDPMPKNGFDQVEFLLSPNVGEDLKPLSRIASGGEASRIMLAIKTILAESDRIPLLIFDEIDTGISGKTGGLLGDKLRSISKSHQVLCVTHMAQIAAKAAHHLLVEKRVADGETKTQAKYINETERVQEVARLLSGGENEEKALELAREMLRSNRAQLSFF